MPLALEAATTLDLRAFLPVHIFLGLALLPAASLKVASAGWRAARYYTGGSEYRLIGPPAIVLRLLAPLLVVATAVLFGTGVAFLVTGDGGGLLLTLHQGSFVVWGLIMVVHVLAYVRRALAHGLPDWRSRAPSLEGVALRRAAVVAGLVAGALVGIATYAVQTSWISGHPRRFREHPESGLAAKQVGAARLPPARSTAQPTR